MRNTIRIAVGTVCAIQPGDHFTIVLPDGTVLSIEQTADDFSVTREDYVAYRTPTSEHAKVADSGRAFVSGYGIPPKGQLAELVCPKSGMAVSKCMCLRCLRDGMER